MIFADKQMVSVILRNLISNALKYAPNSGRVVLGFAHQNQHAVFSVNDNGDGISLEDQARIFEPFHTSAVGTDGEAGTGLGLAICKDFAEKQGAEIYFESIPGKGTTLFVKFKMPLTRNNNVPGTMNNLSETNKKVT